MSGAEGIHLSLRLEQGDFSLDVSLELPGQGVTALFGPSGSGKTTLLRSIAGLSHASGTLRVNGEIWQDERQFVPAHRRAVGYVFQDAALFSHLSVQGNLHYALRRVPRNQHKVTLESACELFGVRDLLPRKPDDLSGGERQRVGLARAVLTSPRLLLLDEPLAALDMARRQEILPCLERLYGELGIPVLYVSHAADEVVRLADHLAVLSAGRVVATGALEDTLLQLDGAMPLGDEIGVVLPGRVVTRDDRWHLAQVECGGGHFWARDEGHAVGRSVRLRVLARDVSISASRVEDSSILNILPAKVAETRDDRHPAQVLVRLLLDGATGSTIWARVTRRSAAALRLAPGCPVFAQVKAVAFY